MRISDFLRSDSGATTVDWVVLTASATGLSLGTFIVVSGGVSGMSTTIGSTLSGYEISGAFAEAFEAVQLAAADFAGGALGGWTGGSAADAGGAIGEVLMLGPGDIAELALDVPEGASQAVFTFDLIGGDSLDGETATVMINGQPVSIATGGHGTIDWNNSGIPGVTVETTVQAQGQQLGGSQVGAWTESVTSVSIIVDNPGQTVTLGVASGTNQPVNDEWFGIDNVTAEAR
ncbi:hypothetical protein N8I71_08435 [Roseibacterium sp. SDUM158016]|jgi:Flp pilus assembly pilin Flp|uniref:hypothetical protein n=1 Tax=Roseicyclus sediminis TaxID=2980997 RepID=UPI0021CFC0E7|nr:hypothetical protein [Roseibacterium sp. SDUM158016]MCU4652856.1 hypothetical protein [Roseibacterium sp. SDUM158016]